MSALTTPEMSDYHSRAFRAQLTTTMDTLLRTAVFEISKVFDSSIYHHQAELVQKTEEITRLQRKLLRAEGKLRDREGTNRGQGTLTITIDDDEQQQQEEQQEPSSYDIPEIVVEVPDDWCAPVAPDQPPVTRSRDVPPVAPPVAPDEVEVQDDYECPSVSLRPLSVSLWRIPAIKQEVDDFETHLLSSLKESPMNSSLTKKRRGRKRKYKHSQNLNLPTRLRHRELRSNRVENLDQDPKKYRSDLPVNVNDGKSSVTKNAGTKAKGSATETSSCHAKVEEKDRKSIHKIYTCKFCKKVFNTEFGLSVHVRSHKKCTVCRKMFPFPSSLRIHMQYCRNVTDESEPKKESSPKKEKSAQNKDDPTVSGKAYSKNCKDCGMQFPNIYALRVHKQKRHMNKYKYPCNICNKRFLKNFTLKKHLHKAHNRKQKEPLVSPTNGDMGLRASSWMKPLEDVVDTRVAPSVSQEMQIPPSKNKDSQLAGNTKPKKLKREASKEWKTMGKEVPDGFSCLQCQKVISTRYLLIEHYRIHTGERPLSCERCGKKFRCNSMKSWHKRHGKCTGKQAQVPCQLCGKTFSTELMCNKHIMDAHKCWPQVCEHCGKGFLNSRCLKIHRARMHV